MNKTFNLTNTTIPAIIDSNVEVKLLSHSSNWSVVFDKRNGIKIPKNICAKSSILNKTVCMSRIILDLYDSKFECDHKDRNIFNNTLNNLRKVSRTENILNRKSRNKSKTSSKYKNVLWNKANKKWKVQIGYKRKTICGGYFDNEIEAATKADDLMIKYQGEFAQLNFSLVGY